MWLSRGDMEMFCSRLVSRRPTRNMAYTKAKMASSGGMTTGNQWKMTLTMTMYMVMDTIVCNVCSTMGGSCESTAIRIKRRIVSVFERFLIFLNDFQFLTGFE